jgi:transcriptional regulator with XRE-family HTH domain
MNIMLTDDEVRVNLAGNLSRILPQRRMTQAQLSRLTGESQEIISRAVRGISVVGSGTIARIAEALDVSMDRLVAPAPSEPVLAGHPEKIGISA